MDFQWLADRTSIIWTSGNVYGHLADACASNQTALSDSNLLAVSSYDPTFDPWIQSIAIFMHRDFVAGHCPTAVQLAWCFLYNRLQTLLPQVDPLLVSFNITFVSSLTNTNSLCRTILSDRSSSLLRSRKTPNEREMHINLWKNYVVMGCCIALRTNTTELRCTSPDLGFVALSPMTLFYSLIQYCAWNVRIVMLPLFLSMTSSNKYLLVLHSISKTDLQLLTIKKNLKPFQDQ